MAGKTVVFYSPQEVAELKKLNREHKKGHVPDLKKRIADWASARNRTERAVWIKFYTCVKQKAKRKYRRKSITVRTPRVNAPKVFVNHTSGKQLRIPITGIQFEPGFMIVSY